MRVTGLLLLALALRAQVAQPVFRILAVTNQQQDGVAVNREVRVVLEVEPAAMQDLELLRKDFRLIENGEMTVEPSRVVPYRELGGTSMVVCLDASGSMLAGNPPAIDQVRRALLERVRQLGPGDRVAIVSFATKVQVLTGFSSDPAALEQVILALEPLRGGYTKLNAGISEGLALFEKDNRPNDRRRLFVVSDGKDEWPRNENASLNPTLEWVLERAEKLKVPIDAIGIPTREPQYVKVLQKLANASQGQFIETRTPLELGAALNRGIQWLQQTPVAVFETERLRYDGSSQEIAVRRLSISQTVTAPPFNPGRLTAAGGGGAPAPQPGSAAGPAPDAGKAPLGLDPKIWWVVGGVGFLLIGGGAALLMRGRRRGALPPPAAYWEAPAWNPPAPEPYAPPPPNPFVAQPLMPESPSTAHRIRATGAPSVAPLERPGDRYWFAPPTPQTPAAFLEIVSGPYRGHRYPVDADVVDIGFQPQNRICIQYDDALSSQHARIRFEQGQLILEDRGSTNGTYVDGRRTTATPLQPGSRIRLGRTDFEIKAG
jgi:Mg-chelatase subunit ChlD